MHKTLKQPDESGTLYLPELIEYDLFIKKFDGQASHFSKKSERSQRWKYLLIKDPVINGMVAKICVAAHFQTADGTLAFDADVQFYLHEIKDPNPAYFMKISNAAFEMIKAQFDERCKKQFSSENFILRAAAEFNSRAQWNNAVKKYAKTIG